ncbi:MAG: cupin domain-containing protein [Gammaproteobacteria bacterium]|jgi:mannose-6-phosphate isomerase-like protein (cupin superfamily)
MKQPRILRPEAAESWIAEGCFVAELSNSDADPDLSIARVLVPPGATTSWHKLAETAERYLILEGEGIVELDGIAPTQVKAGDVVLIPAACRQRITNPAGSDDLLFLALCTPSFRPENYVDAE